MKQFTIIKREDNGKDINRNGFVSVLFLEYYGDIFMYLDEIIVSPKDLMIYDGATDIAFLGTKKRQ